MPDSDKVIKGLETIRYNLLQMKHMLLADFCDDALDILKEQETANIYKCPNCGTWVSAENVVRCKDCKFGEACKNRAGEHGVMCYNSQSASHSWVHEPDWFCADGERGDDL